MDIYSECNSDSLLIAQCIAGGCYTASMAYLGVMCEPTEVAACIGIGSFIGSAMFMTIGDVFGTRVVGTVAALSV